MSSSPSPSGLVFDLEVVPSDHGDTARIHMLGAWRPDLDAELEQRVQADPLPALRQLDALGAGADFVLGHNVLDHDLPIVRALAPDLALHDLPVVDTLRLSPLAFPQNPYHRLVKDYKLIRDSLNSPLSDCRATWTLYQDQYQAFGHLNEASRNELLCYQGLLTQHKCSGLGAFFAFLSKRSDFGAFFSSLTGRESVPLSEVQELIPLLLRETDPALSRDLKVCRTRLDRLLQEDLHDSTLHWPLAYSLAWLRVSGGNSVLAPWVRHQFPAVGALISELRDTPCGQPHCQYCRTTHDPRHELTRYFGYADFRYEKPGSSLQHDIVLAGMRGRHVLAVLATGAGKSLCYQLPALNRFHRNGSLTVIISPLQSLMKDQVDGLLERNIQCAAALNGLLTMPERADVLEKIQMGDVGILLVSPEQFRNKAFRRAVRQRQVGAWIFDEAHCLSKWGSDFRPDYLYVSRFIKEFTRDGALAPIGCFTATAKPDVLADIQEHFRQSLNIGFDTFQGGHERSNLNFDVLPCLQAEKWAYTNRLLQEHIGPQGAVDGAVVFVSSRKNAEELADFLIGQGWACRYFHAGLEPNTKTDIQDDFKQGRLQVIVATNAFGMGVDKKNIRLVVHADIPGSLENYLQEAGRAGRDQQQARCVLLYDPQDIETQFGMSERSKLSLRDIRQILRKLRGESQRRRGGKLLITAGEILLDQAVETSFSAEDRDAETKIVTAISWLERGDYLKREENHTQIFPARLDMSEEQALACLQKAQLPQRRLAEFRAILRFLYRAGADERINTDQIMQLTSLTAQEVADTLRQMEQMGLLINDAQVTVYLRQGVVGASSQRLLNSLELEQALLQCMRDQAPDAEQGGWQDVNLPALTAQLKTETRQDSLLPLHVVRLLRSLAQDRDARNQQRSTFELRQISHDLLKLRIKGDFSWRQISRFGEKRRELAGQLLGFLIGKLPAGLRGKDLLVETSFGELVQVIESDLGLSARIPLAERRKAVEHVLLYLHRQEVLTLNHGLTVMRRAMTIEVNAKDKRKTFLKEDYLRLDDHYREKLIQVHVMREYAQVALRAMADALELVLHYFTTPKPAFIQRYFSGREDILSLATSEESWQSIVHALSPAQREIVVNDTNANRLVLAGPGSGKTRVIVHRIAYLLRVRRVPAASIVALTFNRHAANEIRSRLFRLVGIDAYGVRVMTYHSLAMRLTGTRFERGDAVDERDLKQVLCDAVDLLEGRRDADGDDDLREQLLRGYQYILVDEYQDIDDVQYRMVAALAGRHAEEEGRLCIMAVGDDDQNIYAWRETSNRYIQRFREDYEASIHFLVDNYRSSACIVEASNHVIMQNPDRLKASRPIRINPERREQAPGGAWEALDEARQGRVLRLRISQEDSGQGNVQAQAVMQELVRLLALEQGGWQGCAVLARSHRYLWPVQAWCEQQGIPYFLASDKEAAVPFTRQRGFVTLVEYLRNKLVEPVCAAQARQAAMQAGVITEPDWRLFCDVAFEQLQGEFGDCSLSGGTMVDWLYEYARELREQPQPGLYLGTVHSAKGLEFRHVALLDGDWRLQRDTLSDERRLYYVGMTRAEQTLTLCEFAGVPSFAQSLAEQSLLKDFSGCFDAALQRRFRSLSLKEIDIGFAGRQLPGATLHGRIAAVRPGDALMFRAHEGRYQLLDGQGNVLGRTAQSFRAPAPVEQCDVQAVTVRLAEDTDEQYRDHCRCERWEVVVPRISWLP